MDERPPFDIERASFWLVASVIGLYAVVVFSSIVMCAFNFERIEAGGLCDKGTRFVDLLGTALTAALALAMRRNRNGRE